VQDIEMISSPPSSPEIPGDEDVIVLPFNEDSQETTVSSNVLGASKFRRKNAANTDISSPINPGLSVGVDSRISPSPFDTYDLTQPTSFQVPPTLSPPQYQPSTSATIPTRTGARDYLEARTSSGKPLKISKKPLWKKLQAGTARQAAKRAQKEAYYGVDIHRLLDRIKEEKGFTPHQFSARSSSNCSHLDIVTAHPSKDLWTDKYRATKFVDLLGDERVHRDIMRWIKHWDFCVFGRDIPKSSSYQSTYAKSTVKPSVFGAVPTVDPYQRPQQRILMLHWRGMKFLRSMQVMSGPEPLLGTEL
jgi:hypothetical protein